MTTFPDGPLAAVTHPDPYPYYADLVAHRPLYRDTTLGLWVASSAEVVAAILTSDSCRVRPPGEPVPAPLRGTPAGTIYGHMVRFNDGPGHCPFKRAVSAALGSITSTAAAEQSTATARALAQEIEPTRDPGRLARFAFNLPIYVAARLLGIPDALLPQTAVWAGDFARCLAPGSTPEQVARGTTAAGQLLRMFETVAPTLHDRSASSLLHVLAQEASRVGGKASDDVVIANAIGFLFQAYDATAALIGNTLLTLASQPAVHGQVAADPDLLPEVIAEVLRYDPPVQNTRRFLAQDLSIAGQQMPAGDGVLVILAAAGRDPSANPSPNHFDIFRKTRQTWTFGDGPHACPGATLAVTIATAGIAQLLSSGADPEQLTTPPLYRPSQNLRIALAASEGSS